MNEVEIRETLTRYAAAWTAGDMAAIVACYHDDFTLHYGGRNPLSGDHFGKAAALTVLSEFGRRTSRRLIKVVDVMAGRERGAIVALERLSVDGAPVEIERVLVYAVKDGLLHECWIYDADQELIDRAVGDRPQSGAA
jgi:ketosteroid isomerase-like protein